MSTIYWAELPLHTMQCRGNQWNKECRSVSASSVPFVMDWRYKKERWTHYTCLVGVFPSSFPRDTCCYIMYKESGNHVCTPNSDHEHCSYLVAYFSPSSNASFFAPSSPFVQFVFRRSAQPHTLCFPNGLSAISEVGGRCVSFFPFHKKREKKCTWPGMLLMFLPVNLSTSSVGYWIQYTFLCSNKLKFLNIKGSKREI